MLFAVNKGISLFCLFDCFFMSLEYNGKKKTEKRLTKKGSVLEQILISDIRCGVDFCSEICYDDT